VIVRKLTRDWCAGYAAANPAGDEDGVELLDSQGKLLRVDWSQVKWVCYVRELAEADGLDTINPERLLRRRFSGRPRMAGLWLRVILGDGEELEGVAANDRSLVEGAGLMLTPPDTRSNTQRVFVPRSTIRELTVLGVIAPRTSVTRDDAAQPELFGRSAETP
jgi:PAS domain-containing protein